MVDLTPGVTVVMIGLIVCICCLVLILLLLFIGRRPLIEGGSCWPDEKDGLYRCVGARYESKQEIHRYMVEQRERELSESFEGIRTSSMLPVPPVVVPVTRPQVPQFSQVTHQVTEAPQFARVIEENIYLPPTPAALPTPLPLPPPPPPAEQTYIEEVRRPVQHTWHCDPDGDDDDIRRNRQIVSYGWRA